MAKTGAPIWEYSPVRRNTISTVPVTFDITERCSSFHCDCIKAAFELLIVANADCLRASRPESSATAIASFAAFTAALDRFRLAFRASPSASEMISWATSGYFRSNSDCAKTNYASASSNLACKAAISAGRAPVSRLSS